MSLDHLYKYPEQIILPHLGAVHVERLVPISACILHPSLSDYPVDHTTKLDKWSLYPLSRPHLHQ